MNSKLGLGIGVAAAVVSGCALWWLGWGRKKELPMEDEMILSPNELHDLLQRLKYSYLDTFEQVSANVRRAKEELKYDEACRERTSELCIAFSSSLVFQNIKSIDMENCKELGVTYKALKRSLDVHKADGTIGPDIEAINHAFDCVLEGERVVYPNSGDDSELSQEQYLEAYTRILWRLRQCAYVDLRRRIRANAGKVLREDQEEVKQLIISKATAVRNEVCQLLEIKKKENDEYFTVLQKCFFRNKADPEFTHEINEARSRHILLLGAILQGELIPQLETADLVHMSDRELDDFDQAIVRTLRPS